jgi:hypothetical protein
MMEQKKKLVDDFEEVEEEKVETADEAEVNKEEEPKKEVAEAPEEQEQIQENEPTQTPETETKVEEMESTDVVEGEPDTGEVTAKTESAVENAENHDEINQLKTDMETLKATIEELKQRLTVQDVNESKEEPKKKQVESFGVDIDHYAADDDSQNKKMPRF